MADFLKGFGETVPRGLFSNFLSTASKPARDFFAPRFNDFYTEYQGELAKRTKLGQPATLKFNDFLNKINIENRLKTYSPRQRYDFSSSELTPRTRFLNF